MSVIITGMDMPKSCLECADQRCKVANDWDEFDWCEYKRVDNCPLRSVDELIEKLENRKQYKGKSGNPVVDKHDIGLDRYFDLGLETAIKIIKEYCKGGE